MKTAQNKYLTLFLSTFQLSAFTFGGGFVIIPLMRKKFVEQLHWIEEQEMLDLTAIAQSSPGAIAVNASILIGYRVAGALGALTTILGTILPPLCIISVISYFYQAFISNVWVAALMKGMRCGVAAVIVDVVLKLGFDVVKKKDWVSTLIMLLAFVATYFFKVNVMIIILVCGIVGYINYVYRRRHPKEVA